MSRRHDPDSVDGRLLDLEEDAREIDEELAEMFDDEGAFRRRTQGLHRRGVPAEAFELD